MKLKLIHLPLLTLAMTSGVQAADFSPHKTGGRWQGLLAPAGFRLGGEFVQADNADQTIIHRRLNFALGGPAQTEFGLAILDTQEPVLQHKPVNGAQLWLRWNLLHTAEFQAGTTLQFQPGLATREHAFAASQDRSSLGFDLTWQAMPWMSAAVYADYSRRQEERFMNLLLGDETLAGLRLGLGSANLGIYADGSARHLTAQFIGTQESRQLFAREWQAGLYVRSGDLQVSAFALLPDQNRYFGTYQRGFGASISLAFGGSAASGKDPRDQDEDALQATERADREAATVQRIQGESIDRDAKILESAEVDEFQFLEKEQKAAINQQENAAEKAEREIRQLLETEKKIEARKKIEKDKALEEAKQSERDQRQQDEEKVGQYKDEADHELNRYTLPASDEINWDGLNY